MLSKPFQHMARRRLLLLLIVLLFVEAAGGAGLYVNNRHPSAASTAPTATPAPPAPTATPGIRALASAPQAIQVGQSATFSVRIPDLAHQQVTYVVAYPDGSVDQAIVQADATGFSRHTFVIRFKPTGRQENIGVAIYSNGRQRAFTQLPVQLPTRGSRP